MENIRRVQLSEIAELITKGTTPTTLGYEFQDEGVNFLKIECFDENGNYQPEKAAHISEECNEKLKRSQLKAGDVLFSIAGAIGRVGIVTEEMLPANTNQALAIIRINSDEVYLPYIKLILTSPIVKKQFEKKKQGVAQLNLSLKDINELTIPLPAKDKQVEYAELFTKLGRILAHRKEELASLDELIKARFVELFGSISNNKFGYEVMSLQDVCEPIKDGTHQTPTYTEDTVNGYKFLSSKDVTSGKVDWNHLKYIPEELHKELYKRISPRKGDILLAKNGTTGVAAIVDRDDVFDIYVSLALLRPLGMVTSEYLCSAVNSIETKHQFDSSLKGIGVPNLHLGEIKKTKIVVPPIEAQEQFADFVKQVDKSKVAVQKALDEAQLLFDSLMQEYFG